MLIFKTQIGHQRLKVSSGYLKRDQYLVRKKYKKSVAEIATLLIYRVTSI